MIVYPGECGFIPEAVVEEVEDDTTEVSLGSQGIDPSYG